MIRCPCDPWLNQLKINTINVQSYTYDDSYGNGGNGSNYLVLYTSMIGLLQIFSLRIWPDWGLNPGSLIIYQVLYH
jgi:hypothetical protein